MHRVALSWSPNTSLPTLPSPTLLLPLAPLSTANSQRPSKTPFLVPHNPPLQASPYVPFSYCTSPHASLTSYLSSSVSTPLPLELQSAPNFILPALPPSSILSDGKTSGSTRKAFCVDRERYKRNTHAYEKNELYIHRMLTARDRTNSIVFHEKNGGKMTAWAEMNLVTCDNNSNNEVTSATKEILANNKTMLEKSSSVREEGQTTDTFCLLFLHGRKLCPQRQ